MEHIAIDLGGRESQICVRQSDGTIDEERRWGTARLGEFLARKKAPARVVLETCAEAFAIADQAKAAGHEVRVVPATLVRMLGVGAHGKKTDKDDARRLSDASCKMDLPSVHIPSEQARMWKTMCGMRDSLVQSRTQLINSVRGWLRTRIRRVRTGGTDTFPRRLAELGLELPSWVQRSVRMIEALTSEIKAATVELRQLARSEAVCRRLMTAPGIGPITAVRYVATLDEVGRFPSAHKVEAYLGLVPGIQASSDRMWRTGITKAGSPAMRSLLVEAAWAARRCRRRTPIHAWVEDVERRRGKKVALLALARKLAGILYAMWRDGTVFDPTRGAAQAPPLAVEAATSG